MSTIERLVGVYDADGTLRGEIAYWIGARLGRTHCSLCEITHSAVRRRPGWQRCAAGLPVPFTTHHRDEVAELAAEPPYVAADTTEGTVVLVDRRAIEALGGSAEGLVAAIETAVADHGLTWP